MASTLKHLRSSTADKRPTASGLAEGQLAINTASGTPGLFFKDSDGGVVKVGPVHVGVAAPNAVPAGSAGNSKGELWVDENTTTPGLKYYSGSAFVNLTPSGTTTAVGLVELATPAETQAGSDGIRAVTPSGLQSKVSDSTSTTSSTTIASSTAVKAAYDLANAALPKAGGTITGELLISPSGSLAFEGSGDDSFETTLAVVDPTADRTITFPNITGTVVTTGDSGTVTSTMIADNTIVNADINSAAAISYSKLALSSGIVNTDISASAEIAVSKLANGAARQLLQTDAAGTGVEWTNNVDIPGTLDVTQAATFDSTLSFPLGTAALPSIYPGSDTNTGIYSPGADQLAISTAGVARLRITSSGFVGVGTTSPTELLTVTNGNIFVNDGFVRSASSSLSAVTSRGFRQTIDGTEYLAIYHDNTGAVFNVNSFERARIDSSGKVGIGTTSPARTLDVAGTIRSTTGVAELDNATQYKLLSFHHSGTRTGIVSYDNTNNWIYINAEAASSQVLFGTAGTERARIDSSGRLGIGTSTPGFLLDVAGVGRFGAASTADAAIEIGTNATGNRNAFIDLVGDTTYTDFGLRLIRGNTGANATSSVHHRGTGALQLKCEDLGELQFITFNSTRATIKSDGKFGIGTTSPAYLLEVAGHAAAHGWQTRTGSSGAFGGNVFNIYWNGTNARLYIDATDLGNISVSSDYRIKKNIQSISSSCIDRIKQLRPVQYELNDYGSLFKADGIVREGFIAHEVQEVIPSGAEGDKDEENRIQNLRTDAIVAVLTKALQEAIAKIETLEAKVAALEAA